MTTATLIFTGNAGPGIAIAAAAAALRAADMGHRALLLGFGPTHSLGALLDTALGAAPQQIAPCLDALALDAPGELSAAWEAGRARLPAQLVQIAGDELPIPPGIEMLL